MMVNVVLNTVADYVWLWPNAVSGTVPTPGSPFPGKLTGFQIQGSWTGATFTSATQAVWAIMLVHQNQNVAHTVISPAGTLMVTPEEDVVLMGVGYFDYQPLNSICNLQHEDQSSAAAVDVDMGDALQFLCASNPNTNLVHYEFVVKYDVWC